MTTINSEVPTELDLQSFAKAWVAELIDQGVSGVYPHEKSDRRGFEGVVRALDDLIEQRLSEGADKSSLLPLLRITNDLRPSSAGDYEGFELALRSLQLTFTSSPNPWYDYISFPISKIHAESFLKQLPKSIRDIATLAATAYVTEKRGPTLDVTGEGA